MQDNAPPDTHPTPEEREAQLIASNTEYREQIRALEAQVKQLEAQHAIALKQAQTTHINAFNQFKDDVIVCLKALELVAIASHRHGQIELSHK
ncbi:hypothetical protein, partial [Pseudanabaena sp. 'Roaring Creek']|uniref:hypothetical protein n=1 Tax=Pseudanabaena sp. 'Roaring Creek' TaxID=1681830 RepID=UPI000A7D6185